MSYIDQKSFIPYADVTINPIPENFSYIHDLLAEPVAILEQKGYSVRWCHVPAPFPTLYEETNVHFSHLDPAPPVPKDCHPTPERFRYSCEGDYQMIIAFDDDVVLPNYIPNGWHLLTNVRELFTTIPTKLDTLHHYKLILERLHPLYAWIDSLPERK